MALSLARIDCHSAKQQQQQPLPLSGSPPPLSGELSWRLHKLSCNPFISVKMNQNDRIATTSFLSNGRQVADSSHMAGNGRNMGPARCLRCERTGGGGKPSCWCGAISSTIIVILTLICIYLLYLVVFNNDKSTGGYVPSLANKQIMQQPGTLKLVSVFSRHGDRAPTSGLPRGDNMAEKVAEFWPRGLGNLTDSGRFRMYRLGMELRKRYAHHLDFDASHFLAFSSRQFRCQESLELTLRGLFQLDWTSNEGLELASELALNSTPSHRLPSGSGSPLEYKQVVIDTQTVPSLSFGPKHFPCKYQQEHASLVWNYDPESRTSKLIREFKGVPGLEKLISDRYMAGANASLDDLNDVCGTVKCELQLRRTSASAAYGRHYIDWVNKRAPEFTRANVSLFDLCDQSTALFFDKSLEGTSDRLQLGPVVTSLITSQEAVLQLMPPGGKSDQPRNGITFDSRGPYAPSTQTGKEGAKKIVLYSTHDSVIQPLLYRLGIGRPVASGDEYEEKFPRWSRSNSSITSKFLAGFGTSEFGISFVVELYELPTGSLPNDKDHPQTTAAYVQVALYNEEDPKYQPIEYRRLEFGRICRQLYGEQHQNSSADSFFKQPIFASMPIDELMSCPFDLFKNVTSHYLISTPEFNKLCAI